MKITESLKIIKKIVADPANADSMDPENVASTYAGQCQVVNERLRKCVALIQNNMVQQALDEAGYEPHLIDLCHEMNSGTTPGAWRKLCREKGWAIPEELDMDSFNELMKSFEMEDSIEPLVRQLRRANNRGELGQCVAILREIVRKDSTNPEWKSDLAEFESVYLEKITEESTRLKEHKDINGIAKLVVELKQPWSIPVDTISAGEMELFIEEQYRENLILEEAEIVGRIGIAFQSGNVESLGNAIGDYVNLEKKRYFQPDPSLAVIYSNALNWYNQQLKSIETRKSYEEKLVHLRSMIENGTHNGIRSMWEELHRFPFPVPEELEPDVRILLRKEEKERAAKQRRKQMGYILILLGAALCIFIAATWNYYRDVKNRLVTTLDESVSAEDPVKSHSVVDDMAGRKIALINFALFNQSDMEKQRSKVRGLETLLEKKKAKFKVLIDELEALQAGNFPEKADIIEGKFSEIHLASNAVEKKEIQRLQIAQAAWDERKRVIRVMEEKELSALFDKMGSLFSSLTPAVLPEEMETNEEMLDEIGSLVSEAGNLKSVSDGMKKELESFRSRLAEQKERHIARKRQISSIMGAASLEDYMKALKTFAGAFPEDPLTEEMSRILKLESRYSQFLAVPSEEELSRGSGDESSEEGEDDKDNGSGNGEDRDNPFWHSTSESLKAIRSNIELHRGAVEEELLKMEKTARFVDMWECTVNRPNFEPEKWYFNGRPTLEYIKGVKSYAGIAYILSSEDTQPDFKANNAISILVQDLKKMDHCEVVQQMINTIRFDVGVESIFREIKNIYGQPFSPILRLHLINFLTEQILTLAGKENAPPFVEMASVLKRFNNQVNWLCTTNSRYEFESRQALALLNHFLQKPESMNEYVAQIEIRKRAIRRTPAWIGFADFRNPDELHIKTGRRPGEIWVVRDGADENGESIADKSHPFVLVTEESGGGESVRHLEHRGYLPGEPLFAPYDNITTKDVLKSIYEDTGADSRTDIKWPESWPVNVRDFQSGF